MAVSAFSCHINLAGTNNIFPVPQGVQKDYPLPGGYTALSVAWGKAATEIHILITGFNNLRK